MTISRVHMTPHMHWDREWYFTTEESRILLVNNMEEIMTRLESDPEYKCYVLDGQTAILEDYFAVVPENEERVRKLAKEGRLILGPWYSQTDTMQVSGESIVRNMMYGMRDCLNFAEPMKIGYLPDSFSMSSQLPHIYSEFDITRTMFWRGCSERHGTNKTEFLWQSNDGSEVVAQVLPLGYAIGKYLPQDEAGLRERLDKYLPVLEGASVTKDVLLPNGHDQMPIQKDIFEVMDKLREIYPDREFIMDRFEDTFEKIEAMREDLDTIKGEFNDGKYMRVHRTISSTRMDIKLAHAEVENKIVNILEPLAAIAYSQGYDYHHGLIEKMWKESMKNHAHDSIGCCCSDKVHAEILGRYVLADDMASNLINFYMRKIVDNMPRKEGVDVLTMFNLAPYARKETVRKTIRIRAQEFKITDLEGNNVPFFIEDSREIDPGLVDRQIVHYGNYDPFMEFDIQLEQEIPAMGYTTFYITAKEVGNIAPAQVGTDALENEFCKVTVNANGTIDILDKTTGTVYAQALELEEGSDDGDEYDYSPLEHDWLLYSTACDIKTSIEHQAYRSVAHISYRMSVPANLEERQSNKTTGYIDVKAQVVLNNTSQRIDVSMEIDNQADDHRVRVLVPTPFKPETVVADNQFGCITRTVDDEEMHNGWRESGWKEAPVPVWQLMNFAALEENNSGIALMSNGLREFEVIAKENVEQRDTFALTLFRGVGFLGKEKLFLRPGRPSGIKMPTPDSQVRGKLTYNFSLFAYAGDHISANVMQEARDNVTPIQVYNMIPYNAMKLNLVDGVESPTEYSLMSMPKSGAVLSAIKKAEDDDALIVRAYNPSEASTLDNAQVVFNKEIKQWAQVNLSEVEKAEQPSVTNGSFGEFSYTQSKTFKAKF